MGEQSMKIKVKKSYTYKEVCGIVDKAIVYGVRAYIKEISEYNKYVLDSNKKKMSKDVERYE